MATVSDFQDPALFKSSWEAPLSANTVAEVDLQAWPVYFLGSDKPRNLATLEGYFAMVFFPTGELMNFVFLQVRKRRPVWDGTIEAYLL